MGALTEADRTLLRYLASRLREALAAVEKLQSKLDSDPPPPPTKPDVGLPWEDSSDELQPVPAKPKVKKKKKPNREPVEKVADEMNATYPHGWSEAGKKRPPGLTQTVAWLRKKKAKGYTYEEILDGCRRYRDAIGGTPDQQYAKAMFRWVKDELWREVPEDVAPKERGPTPEEVAEYQKRRDENKRRRLEDQARRAGVQLDPTTGKVVDWGPGGPPNAVR